MKKLLSGLFLLLCFAASAQTYKIDNVPYRQTNKLGVPVKTVYVPGIGDSATIWLNPADSSFNWTYKGGMQKAATKADSSLLRGLINSLIADSVYQASQIAIRMKYTDTVTLSNRIDQRVKYSDTSTLSNRIDLKADKSTTINGHSLATGTVTVSASDLTTGTLPDARLSTNVTVQGNAFNSNNQLLLLDAGGKVPFSNLPAALMIYKGTWNAATNTPTLSDGTGVSGWVYIVSTGGTANLGSGSITLSAGDYLIHNGSTWQRSVGTNNVASVNGQQGVVVLNTSHISESGNLYYTDTRARAAISETITGIDYSSGVFSITSGYQIPTTNNPSLTGTASSLSIGGNAATATLAANATQWNGNIFDGGGFDDTHLDFIMGYSSVANKWTGYHSGDVKTWLGLTTSNWVDLTSDQTLSGQKIFSGNTTRIYINRGSTSNYNGIEYLTNNVAKWFVGMRENLSSDNFIYYSETTNHDVLTLNNTTDAVSVYGDFSAGGTLSANLSSGTTSYVAYFNPTSKEITYADAAGPFSPSSSAETNCSSVSFYGFSYTRIGNKVHVSGRVSVTVTSGGVMSFEMTLPIPSNFGYTYDATGIGIDGSQAGYSANANDSTDKIVIGSNSAVSGGKTISIQIDYTII